MNLDPKITVDEVLGKITRVDALTMRDNEDCSECGRTLRYVKGKVLLACSGSYCSRRCAESHAVYLVPELQEDCE